MSKVRISRRQFAKTMVAASALSQLPEAVQAQEASAVPSKLPQRPGLHLPARFIPVPSSVSPEAQAALARPNPYGPNPSDVLAGRKSSHKVEGNWYEEIAKQAERDRPAKLVEHRLSHATLYEIVPATLQAEHSGKALFYVHGGAFIAGGGIAAAQAAYGLARLAGLRTFSIDYRMPPQSPFPAGLDDAVEAYRFMLDRFGAANVAAYGVSAGGGLVASCLLKARDLGMGMPAACVLHSPEADLTESGDSFETNLGIDSVLMRLTDSIALYANGHDLKDPYLSPLFGDFKKGFPPTILTAGTRDLFLSNSVRMHRSLKRAGIAAELSIWEAMGHGGFYGSAPEDEEMQDELVQFVRHRLLPR